MWGLLASMVAKPLLGAAANALMGGKKKKKNDGSSPLNATMTDSEARGRAAEDAYYNKASGFDANTAARESSMASYEDFREKMMEDMASLHGNQVGRGRLNTGPGMQDEDRMVRGGIRDLNRTIAGNAMEAARMNMANTRDIGGYGERLTQRGTDLRMSKRDRKAQEAASKRGMWGQLGGAALGAAGTYLCAKYGGR